MKKKSKGGKRAGAGRPPLADAKVNIPLRVAESDVKKWGGKSELKKKLYAFIAFPSQFDSVSVVNFPIPSPKGQKPKDDPRLNTLVQLTEKTKNEVYDAPMLTSIVVDEAAYSNQTIDLLKKAIEKQISAIKAEKCPKERDTPMGRRSWAVDQHKRIQELQNKLNEFNQ